MKKTTQDLIIKNNTMLKFCAQNNYHVHDNYNYHYDRIDAIFLNNERDKYVSRDQQYADVSVKNGKFYVNSWCISGHNGDEYGFEKKEITEDEYFIFAERASKDIFEHYIEAKKQKIKRDADKAAAEAFKKKCEKELEQQIKLENFT